MCRCLVLSVYVPEFVHIHITSEANCLEENWPSKTDTPVAIYFVLHNGWPIKKYISFGGSKVKLSSKIEILAIIISKQAGAELGLDFSFIFCWFGLVELVRWI